MSVKTFQVGRDNPSNVTLMYLFSWMAVDKRTVLRGNEIDLIGQLNVAWLLGHSRGSASMKSSYKKLQPARWQYIYPDIRN